MQWLYWGVEIRGSAQPFACWRLFWRLFRAKYLHSREAEAQTFSPFQDKEPAVHLLHPGPDSSGKAPGCSGSAAVSVHQSVYNLCLCLPPIGAQALSLYLCLSLKCSSASAPIGVQSLSLFYRTLAHSLTPVADLDAEECVDDSLDEILELRFGRGFEPES